MLTLPSFYRVFFFKYNFAIVVFFWSIYYFFYLPFFWLKLHRSVFQKFNNYFFIFITFFYLKYFKYTFSGKGYKVFYSLNTTLSFNFGFSHLLYFYSYHSLIYPLTKTSGFFLGLNSKLLKNEVVSFYLLKPLNIFTLRGLKLKAFKYRKKVGKLSLYF